MKGFSLALCIANVLCLAYNFSVGRYDIMVLNIIAALATGISAICEDT